MESLAFVPSKALLLDSVRDYPVLALLGEPGIGKSTAMRAERTQLTADMLKKSDRYPLIDLGLIGTDLAFDQKVVKLIRIKLRNTKTQLHAFFDGLDEGLRRLDNLVPRLLDFFSELPHNQLKVCIACRTAEWPVALEDGLRELWGQDSVGTYHLAPLRRRDVVRFTEQNTHNPKAFLEQVANLGADPLASTPITLLFMLGRFNASDGLPASKADLYREGCQALCEEWQEHRRRARDITRLTVGQRFAVAKLFSAVTVFCRRTAIWIGPATEPAPSGDLRADSLFGRIERFQEQTISVGTESTRETLDTGLFRFAGRSRLRLSHETYAEFLAALYLVDRRVPTPAILRLILHPDGSGKVIPQLRETAAWLAAMLPEVCQAILSTDPESLLLAADTQMADSDRAHLVRQLLRAYDSGEILNENLVRSVAERSKRQRFRYPGLSLDLRPYVRGEKSRNVITRRVAILIAHVTSEKSLLEDLLQITLDESEPNEVRLAALSALVEIGDVKLKASLKTLVTDDSPGDLDDGLKGGALFATWPNHVDAPQLFSALTFPKRPESMGPYQQFLRSDIVGQIQAQDMCRALDWARGHSDREVNGNDHLGILAIAIVCKAIDLFNEPGVCDLLAGILLQRGVSYIRNQSIAETLQRNRTARQKIQILAIEKARDVWEARYLSAVGMYAEEDFFFLLDKLENCRTLSEQEKYAKVLAFMMSSPWVDTDEFVRATDRMIATARTNATLLTELAPLVNAVELGSKAAKEGKEICNRSKVPREENPDTDAKPRIKDVLLQFPSSGKHLFGEICSRISGGSVWLEQKDGKIFPQWLDLDVEQQKRVLDAAELFVLGNGPSRDLTWFRQGKDSLANAYGYSALRLLCDQAPEIFNGLSASVWRDWMASVFGDLFFTPNLDDLHARLIRRAYLLAADRFLEVFEEMIGSLAARRIGTAYLLGRLKPVWDDRISQVLRRKLADENLGADVSGRILARLIEAGDAAAFDFAINQVKNVISGTDSNLGGSLTCAYQLLIHDVSAWKFIWPAIQQNSEFGIQLFSSLGAFNKATGELCKSLREEELAHIYVWLIQHQQELDKWKALSVTNTGVPVRWLNHVVLNELGTRGTAAACMEIKRIQQLLPDERLEFHLKATAELVRRNTWTPFSTAELLTQIERGSVPFPENCPTDEVSDFQMEALEAPRTRGRPARFTTEQLRDAREMKKIGRTNNEIAKLLYATKTPDFGQRRSVPTILKYHFGTKR